MAPLRARDVDGYLRDPGRKQEFVTPMFDLVAPRYDEFTRRFSFGMDRIWKRELVAMAVVATPSSGRVLDVACGTGDLALAVARERPDVAVMGVDPSRRMLEIAAARLAAASLPNVEVAAGDLACLSLSDASVDVVTGGYALRNAPSWRDGLAELARVLRPGGHLLTLDFYRPEVAMWRGLYLSYLSVAGRLVGWQWHRQSMAYGYIARSIAHFVSWQTFARGLEASGFRVVRVLPRLGGGIALHHAIRV